MKNLIEFVKIRAKLSGRQLLSFDELAGFPAEQVKELEGKGHIVQIEDADGIVCTECDKHCWKHVETRQKDGRAIGVIYCEDEDCGGLIQVELERLQQWEIVKEKLRKKQKAKKDDTPRINRQQKEINDKTLLISTLLAHHKFNMVGKEGHELIFEPIGQNEIAKQLRWSQSKVSRLLERSFPEGFWERYKLACKSEALKGFLKILDDNQVEIEAIA